MTHTQTSSADERKLIASLPLGSLINGTWSTDGERPPIPVEDPATGETLCEVPDVGVGDAIAALDAASDAQHSWASTPPRQRGELLRRAFEAVIDRREEIALLITLEMGKPLAEARAEVTYGAEFLRWFSEEAPRLAGRYADHAEGTGRVLTHPQPVGPCLLITPWNFPLAMATRKIGPAIAAGCTMIVKPARQTPLTTLLFAKIMEEAGLPPGVLNVLTTSRSGEITEKLVLDGRIRKISFTGSTEVGRDLLALGAQRVLRCSMELGGNAPLIIFDDANLDAAIDAAIVAKLRNGGESCTAANRFYVQDGIAESFIAGFAKRMSSMRVGRGTEDVQVGPLIDQKAREKVQELLDDAVSRGARVVCGGHAPDGPGYFYEPTVLDGVTPDARALREEIFGPVAPIVTFSKENEAVKAANATEFGLVAYLFTRDLDQALRVSDRLDSGMVGINQGMVSNAAAPFGGVKQSGIGREGGPEGIAEYIASKYIAIASPPSPPDFGGPAGENG